MREWLILEAFIGFKIFRSCAPSKIITQTAKGSALTATDPWKVQFEICQAMILESEEAFFFPFFFPCLEMKRKPTDRKGRCELMNPESF